MKERVSASTQNQALSALLFVYRHVIGREAGDPGTVIRAGEPKRLPVIMTHAEVKAVISLWKTTKTGEEGRRHVHETTLQRAVKEAVRKAGIVCPLQRRPWCSKVRSTIWRSTYTDCIRKRVSSGRNALTYQFFKSYYCFD